MSAFPINFKMLFFSSNPGKIKKASGDTIDSKFTDQRTADFLHSIIILDHSLLRFVLHIH